MKMFILATAASAALAFPALAQTETQPQPSKPTTQQSQPMNQPAQQGSQAQAGANMQDINPNTLSRRQIQKVQRALDKNGFSAGRTDGRWGRETQTALTRFQQSKNMSGANGQLDNATLSALQLNPDQFGQGQGAANSGATGANSASTKNNSGGASPGAAKRTP